MFVVVVPKHEVEIVGIVRVVEIHALVGNIAVVGVLGIFVIVLVVFIVGHVVRCRIDVVCEVDDWWVTRGAKRGIVPRVAVFIRRHLPAVTLKASPRAHCKLK